MRRVLPWEVGNAQQALIARASAARMACATEKAGPLQVVTAQPVLLAPASHVRMAFVQEEPQQAAGVLQVTIARA